jgi:putative FmdB family regulatory protein
MPFYEYVCDSCGHDFEAFQKMSDAPKSECPECGAKVRRKIFAPPVILRGAGFYETEYGRSKHNHPNAKGEGAGKGTNALNSSPSGPACSAGSEGKSSSESASNSEKSGTSSSSDKESSGSAAKSESGKK